MFHIKKFKDLQNYIDQALRTLSNLNASIASAILQQPHVAEDIPKSPA